MIMVLCGINKAQKEPPIAQSVEQLPFKEKVPGSIPGGRTVGEECGQVAKLVAAPVLEAGTR